MSDALLPYYNRELNAIRELARDFAARHPKIAGRLRLAPDAIDDPHVARLLEGVAFLAARVHHRLDDEFPELTDALLGVLYPHYLAPVPSAAIAEFTCQPELTQPLAIAPGFALETEAVRGETCRYRTVYPLLLWPIAVEGVRLSGLPLAAPANSEAEGAAAVLRITLSCATPEATFSALGVDRLRFFLRGGPNVALALYELLLGQTLSVAFADGPTDPKPVIVPAGAVAPVGFAAEEALLPWPARSFSGFRLLTEFFAFPEKFLFFDITGIDAKTLVEAGRRLEIFIYLRRAAPELERAVGPQSLALGCSPIVNLFPQRCEPVPLAETDTEYRLVADARRQAALEVYAVERVRETRADGSSRPWHPFYRLSPAGTDDDEPGGFYHAVRRASPAPASGTEIFLEPFEAPAVATRPADAVLSVDALCLNRDLPAELPFGGGHPRLALVAGAAALTGVNCLTAPTPTLRPTLRERGFWRLVSHLSLGHLSVVGGEAGATALKEMLRLYDLRDSAETHAAIEGLIGVSAAAGVARLPGGRLGAFCRGLDVTLEFDPRSWQAAGLFLMASVLERFLALHASVNSFVRTRAVLRGRPGPAAAWPARAGARVLL